MHAYLQRMQCMLCLAVCRSVAAGYGPGVLEARTLTGGCLYCTVLYCTGGCCLYYAARRKSPGAVPGLSGVRRGARASSVQFSSVCALEATQLNLTHLT